MTLLFSSSLFTAVVWPRSSIRQCKGLNKVISLSFRCIEPVLNAQHWYDKRFITYDSSNAFLTSQNRSNMCRRLGIPDNRIFLTISEARQWRSSLHKDMTVGFVPTMGKLHDGHISLLKASKAENDISIASVYVNPAQFSQNEDFLSYPRDFEKDAVELFKNGADFLFIPRQDEIYPGSQFGQTSTDVISTHVVPSIQHGSEGEARPGHFQGVCTLVTKFLNILQPYHMYLGQKDGLQVILCRRLILDLNFPTKLRIVETARESDGLAMSSRNIYLSKEQRHVANTLYRSLVEIKKSYNNGERSYSQLIEIGNQKMQKEPLFKVEYISICGALDGIEFSDEQNPLPDSDIMVSAAVNFGDCRILDNILLGKQT